MSKPIHVLILTGAVGVGKTKTSRAISDLLTNRGFPNAVIDMDCLRWAYPRPEDDSFHMRLGFNNLASIWPNFRQIGIGHLVIPHVIESRTELEAFDNAIPGSTFMVIRLTADIETIHRRLEAREIGEALVWHQQRATELVQQFRANDLADACVDTNGKPIAEVAEDVLATWLHGHRRPSETAT